MRHCGRAASFAARLALAAIAAGAGACTTIAGITNAGEPPCGEQLQAAVASILVEQGESAQVGAALGHRTREIVATGLLGPRPFELSSPGGRDYEFSVELSGGTCILRLDGTQQARPLDRCRCSE
jgi:hypothetical protein